MNRLDLEIIRQSGNAPLVFEARRVVNAGYAGRDPAAVRRHIEELQRAGVAPPSSVPVLFPIPCANVTTAGRIEAVEEKTSGEVEFVLLAQGDRLYVGIGSDHTDRVLEAVDVLKSKQACPNVLGRAVWDYEEIQAHWDRLRLQSWVRPNPADEWALYQSAEVATLLAPAQILDLVRSRVADHRIEGTIIFSGTVPLHGGEVVCGSGFRCALVDPVLRRSLHCTYDIARLSYLRPESPPAIP